MFTNSHHGESVLWESEQRFRMMAKNIQDGLVNSVRHGDITDTHLTMTNVTAFFQREQELLTHIKTFETSNPCLQP